MAQRGQRHSVAGDEQGILHEVPSTCGNHGSGSWSVLGTKPKRGPRHSVPLTNFLSDGDQRQEVKILRRDASMAGNAWLRRPIQPHLDSEAEFPFLNGASTTTTNEPPTTDAPCTTPKDAVEHVMKAKSGEAPKGARVVPVEESAARDQRSPKTPANGNRAQGSAPKSAPGVKAELEENGERKKAKRRRNRKKKTGTEQPTSQSLQIWDEAKFEKFRNASLGSAVKREVTNDTRALPDDTFSWPSLGAGDEEALQIGSKSPSRKIVAKDDDQWVDISEPWIQPSSGETSLHSDPPMLMWSSVVKSAIAKGFPTPVSRKTSKIEVHVEEEKEGTKRKRRRKKGTSGKEGSTDQVAGRKKPQVPAVAIPSKLRVAGQRKPQVPAVAIPSKLRVAGQKKPQVPAVAIPSKLQEPMRFDLTAVIQTAKMKKSEKLREKATTVKDEAKVKSARLVANILDSTAPKLRRGKEREKPKAKKHSKLKKLILAARARNVALKKNLKDINWEDAEVTILEPGTDETQPRDGSVEKVEEVTHGREEAMKSFLEACRLPGAYVFKKNFRDYCSNFVTKEINELATKLIRELMRFQDRLHQRDPAKAKMKRRLVYGLRECVKHGGLKKLKAVLIAPDLEEVDGPGGLNDVIAKIKALSEEHGFPIIASLHRRKFGYVCLKKSPVSAVGVMDYSGGEDIFKSLLGAFEIERDRLVARLQEVRILIGHQATNPDPEGQEEEKPEEHAVDVEE